VVVVIAGDDAGERGKVLKVDRPKGKVVVEGINRVYKHVRKSQKNPQGGRLSKEMPIPLANVSLLCPSCSAATRVGARYRDDGSKERYCRKCGASLGELTSAQAAYVKK
jgi:large subunit ribosomal protein L24